MFLVEGKDDDLGVHLYCLSHIHNLELMQYLSNNHLSVPELMSRMFALSVRRMWISVCALLACSFSFLQSHSCHGPQESDWKL